VVDPADDPAASFQSARHLAHGAAGGSKIRLVSGPGTGFTRNSRSVIIAKWTRSDSKTLSAIHKRLVKIDIASLHTRCPTGLSPRG
jgi:hypothetical protein